MTDDEQEAHSRRYSNAAFFVLPLSSGRIAVLTPTRDLYAIVDDWQAVAEVGARAATIPRRDISFPRTLDLGVDLTSIDI